MSRSDPERSEAQRARIARLAVSFVMILVLARAAPSTSWLLAIAVAYGLIMVGLLWRRSTAEQQRRGSDTRAFRFSLMLEAVMFTLVLSVLGGLQTPLVGLYGLLVLIGGLVGGSRGALQVGAVATASYALAFGLQQQLLLPRFALGAHLAPPGAEIGGVLRDFFLWFAMVGAMVFATAIFTEQVRERARRAEILYSSLFNAAHEPIVVYDPDTLEILDVNPAAVEVAGRPREELVGSAGMEFLPQPDHEIAQLVTLHRRHAGDTLHRYVRPDGEERILAASPPARMEGSHAVVSVIKDITDAVRRAEEQRRYAEELERKVDERTRDLERVNRDHQNVNRRLRELQGRLVEAQHLRAVEALAGSVAHSVNNPLQALLGTIELEIESSAEPSTGLQRSLLLAKRIQRVVDSTLDLVRRGSLQLRFERPAELVLAVEDELRERARQQGVAIHTKIEPDAPEIYVDRTLLLSALGSIAENALEAMPRGGELELRLDVEPAAKAVYFSIADTGPGIPVEIRCKVIEPFFTTKGGGTGLGLAIANGIIQGHQGSLRIEKAPSGGALVQVQLKADPSAELAGAPGDPEAPS